MTAEQPAESQAAAPAGEPMFESFELEQFDRDDATAGRSICKMLALFFLYTVVIMSAVGWWTYTVSH